MVGVLGTRWHKAPLARQERLLRTFERWPDLHEAYHVNGDFALIYDMAIGPNQAEHIVDSWAGNVPPYLSEWFSNVMIPNYARPLVLNCFDEPYATGHVEGTDAIVGDCWRAGRGYATDVLRFDFVDRPLDLRAALAEPLRLPRHVILDYTGRLSPTAPADDDHPLFLPRPA